jgi:eukaryotic-like serine/threonine-protein kinase
MHRSPLCPVRIGIRHRRVADVLVSMTLAILMPMPALGQDAAPTTSRTARQTDQPIAGTDVRHPSSTPAAGVDWPMFRGNPQLTGTTSNALPAKLDVIWKYEAPQGTESSPAIVADSVYCGCDDGTLRALALNTGAVRWAYETKTTIRSSPLVCDGVVFFGDDRGTFHAVDAGTGRPRWTFRTRNQIISSANTSADRIIFGSYDGNLYCLARSDGKLLWKCETEDKVHGTPAIADGNALFAGCDGRLHIVRLADGSSAGEVDLGGPSGAAAAARGNRVYIGTMSNRVLGVDWAARRIVWFYERADQPMPFLASAAITEHLVVVGGRDRQIYALEADTGKPRWTFATRGQIDASPVITGNRVFVGSGDGILYVLDLADGRLLWKFEAGSAIIASPAVGRNRLVVGTEDGVVYCLGTKE